MSPSQPAMSAPSPVLFHTTPVPLFIPAKDPASIYWLNCLLSALAAALLRLLVAARPALERRAWGTARLSSRRHRAFTRLEPGTDDEGAAALELEDRSHAQLPHDTVSQGRVAATTQRVVRALFEVLTAALGYLLYVPPPAPMCQADNPSMLVVMTMNAGYFLSLLLGVFLSAIFLGPR